MKKWIAFLVSVITMLGILVAIDSLEDPVYTQQKQVVTELPPVSVISVSSAAYRGYMSVLAEVSPKWQLNVRSHVRGKLVYINSDVNRGNLVKKDKLLVRIEDTSYQMALAEAEYSVAEAKVKLLREQNKSRQEVRNWALSKVDGKPSEFALNKPQIASAQANLKFATSRLEVAKKNLSYTRIEAPFEGYLSQRHIHLGQSVEVGDELLQLISSRELDIKTSLSQEQIIQLPEEWHGLLVELTSLEGASLGQARLQGGGGYLNSATRLYSLYLTPEDSTVLASGSFIKVNLPIKRLENVLIVPASSLTRNGYVWWLNNEGRLNRFKAGVLLHDSDNVIIEIPDVFKKSEMNRWQIAKHPFSFFTIGKQVNAIKASRTADDNAGIGGEL